MWKNVKVYFIMLCPCELKSAQYVIMGKCENIMSGKKKDETTWFDHDKIATENQINHVRKITSERNETI